MESLTLWPLALIASGPVLVQSSLRIGESVERDTTALQQGSPDVLLAPVEPPGLFLEAITAIAWLFTLRLMRSSTAIEKT